MANNQHYFLDYEGLKDLLEKIRDHFASQEALTSETNLRKAADDLINESIQTLSESLNSSIQLLDEKVDTEITDRTNADIDLGTRIDNEATARADEDASIHSAILVEHTGRVEADSALGEALDDLKSSLNSIYNVDPDTAEESGVLIDKINNVLSLLQEEVNNRTESDTQLSTRIDNEVTLRSTADESIRNDMASEHAERVEVETNLSSSIVDETNVRITKDAELKALIEEIYKIDSETDAESGVLITKINEVLTLLREESQTRESGDDSLLSSIKDIYYLDPETQQESGKLIDVKNQLSDVIIENTLNLSTIIREIYYDMQEALREVWDSVTTESNERTAADTELRNSINAEVQNRQTQDTVISNLLSEETEAREAEDNNIRDLISEEKAAVDLDISLLSDRITELETAPGVTVDTEMSDISENAVQNKVIKEYIDNKTIELDSEMSNISENAVQNKVIKEYIDTHTFTYKLKGSVENYEDLPTENLSKGDMYNVINPSDPDPDHHYDGNTNFVWDGDNWFALSSTIDLSNYYTKGYIDEVVQDIEDNHYTKDYIDTVVQSVEDDYYNKQYIDENIYTKTESDENYYTKDFIDQNFYTVDHVDDIIDGYMDDFNILSQRIDNIELGNITEIKLNDTALIPDHGSISLYTSIQVCQTLPEDGDVDKLYRVGNTLYKWANNTWVEIGAGGSGGSDPELRAEFEAYKDLTTSQISTLSSAMATDEDLEEHENAENPHHITKETLGLDKVLNYSPTEILEPAMEILETKVNTEDMEDALSEKIAYTDVVDDLVTPEVDKPLSANQGIVLDEKIDEVNARITSLGAALVFKGTVSSYDNLPVDADEGDCYQIFSDESDPHHGEVYAKTESGWTQIVASAQDMSSLIASPADVNRIISDYR